MQIIVVLAITGIFVLLGLVRLGGAHRAMLIRRAPALAFAAVAALEVARGGVWTAVALAAAALIAWVAVPSQVQPKHAAAGAAPVDPRDIEARKILGVSLTADAAEIRAAHRAKMAQAHPDKGGSHAAAARLNAARDRLLRR